jgi:iron(III) transport system permease protein
VAVAPDAPAAGARPAGGLPRPDGWAVAALVVALVVAAPLLVLPGAFLDPRVDVWWDVTDSVLGEAVRNTLLVGAGVGAGTLLLGTSLALLVSFYDFPGRRVLDWALILPLALPAYVLTFVWLGQVGFDLPLRSPAGAIVILTLAFYPYVYLLARAAFRGQGGHVIEAARSLGASRLGAIVRVALPMARPALAAGTLLAMMEALADFGSVQLLGVRTFTVAIYQVWFGAFDRLAATQLATFLMGLTLALFALERLARGRARFEQQGGRAPAADRVRLRGMRGLLAAAFPAAVLAIAFLDPLVQLLLWSAESFDEPLVRSGFATWARNSVLLALMAALIAVPVALLLVYGLRVAPSRLGRVAASVASVGYGVPGSVVAVGALVVLSWVDHRLQDAGELAGLSLGLLLTGSALGLVFAYVVRFLAIAFQSLESQMARLPPSLDAAARSLGADRLEVMWRVHLPLLRMGMLVAALLVFVETMKELPATVLLRPFGGDTLAVAVWQSTTESLWEAAALPALAIVAVGLVPVVLLMRALDRSGRRDLVGG